MTITIKLKTDNASFQDGAYIGELSRILSRAQDLVLLGHARNGAPLTDSNGNTVGTVTVRGK